MLSLSFLCSFPLSSLLLTFLPLNTGCFLKLKLAITSCLLNLSLLSFLKLFKLSLLLLLYLIILNLFNAY
jgi:hypothetical protein